MYQKLKKWLNKFAFGYKIGFFTKVFGCQQNEFDIERVKEFLVNVGFISTDKIEEAGLIVINTCAVRHSAEDKIFGYMGELKKIKNSNPNVFIIILGCMTQQKHIKERILKSYPHVDLILGTSFDEFSKIFKDFNLSYLPKNECKNKSRALISIISGCNNFCSYCIVPFVRGRERSKDINEILEKVNTLIKSNCKDITLLGQNVNSYGNDFIDSNINFSVLLNEINKIKGDYRLRFMTSHPKDFSDELIHAIKNNKYMCNHIHLPFQSGSNKILNLMNRKYTREKYLEIINKIKFYLPNFFITGDVIVGFPGENEDDFGQTLSLIKEVNFISVFSFIYSPRKHTFAYNLKDTTTRECKIKRMQEFIEIQRKITERKLNELLDKEFRVLIENHEDNFLTGRLDNNLTVKIKNTKETNSKEFYFVRINKIEKNSLFGEFVNS
ncbi:MAG: tRNA (N6-isopentenyl adenosine(37)-C2)-methylthiotransferase MiaB [Candidatus Improbicoccus pseudotrichonymphae]|uniref:tRNA-2-methylthio-N(6)-dimethylallyladenosine synthase n=1 Tax=Candidatus Improbicoccus pseudotrichonymphae TaxID=3033792 RepID=A0AA48HUS0_9FIRM|nr:MAG: tRNA (N6-isopentenyl adenosine(37)-C2)-methylthiotransferase MiaB [Candidatus Improbicoccus pseudotrichonymphae]